jgi:hypothetical protein
VALAEGALALPLVEAGFLVGAMMKDENVREMKQRNKVKKEEKHAKRKYEIYWCTTICTVNHVKQFEIQGYYHTNVEMYRDTTDHRNIQKKWARCQKNMGGVINHLQCTKQNQNRKRGRMTVEQETYNEVHKKQRQ